MSLMVLARSSVARSSTVSNADRLVVTESVAAVVDGTTPKPWHSEALSGVDLADRMVDVLNRVGSQDSPDEVVRRLTEAAASAKADAGCAAWEGAAATVAVLLLGPRIVLRIGDPWVRIARDVHEPHVRAERAIASVRALMAECALADGAEVEEMRNRDTAREAVLPLLRKAERLRNHPTSCWAFAAVDGSPIPDRLIERWSLPEQSVVVTLASDGYPTLGPDLRASEHALAGRLADDPLVIGYPPATKGSRVPGESFDDRTYLSVRVAQR